jgi:hypothetical protein
MAVTVSGTGITFNDATVQTTAATGGVTSAVAGNGVAVSGATGAVTFSLGVPTGSSVGTYTAGSVDTNTAITIGATYAGSTLGVIYNNGSFTAAGYQAFASIQNPLALLNMGLSGTWRACSISKTTTGNCCYPSQRSGNLWIRIA